MEFLIMPFSDDGGIDEGCNYCGQCIYVMLDLVTTKQALRFVQNALLTVLKTVGILFVIEA